MDCEDCRHLTVVGLHDTGPWSRARDTRRLHWAIWTHMTGVQRCIHKPMYCQTNQSPGQLLPNRCIRRLTASPKRYSDELTETGPVYPQTGVSTDQYVHRPPMPIDQRAHRPLMPTGRRVYKPLMHRDRHVHRSGTYTDRCVHRPSIYTD